MIWMDRRAEAEAVRLTELIGAGGDLPITGNRPDAFYVAARLLWLHDAEPEVLKKTWKFVQVNGYINYRLTGRVAMDPAHAVLLQNAQLLHRRVGLKRSAPPASCTGAVPRVDGGAQGSGRGGRRRPPRPADCGLEPR